MGPDAGVATVQAGMTWAGCDLSQDDPRFPVAQGWSRWPAPAKLNRFLRIVGRRADGYHRLQTVFALLDWGDTVHLRPRADGRIVLHGPGHGVAADHDLCVRAARALRDAASATRATVSELGVEIAVDKRIPLGGGFGGGSSDAATVLVALDALWGTRLGAARLAELGLSLGADVPVFVHGNDAWAEGVGEILTRVDLPPAWYVLVDPGARAPTAALFQAADLTRDAVPATMPDFVAGRLSDNAFEPVLRRREPAVDAALAVLAQVGLAQLTGSGSGCFAAFGARAQAHAGLKTVRALLPAPMSAWLAAGAMQSALRQRLALWMETASG